MRLLLSVVAFGSAVAIAKTTVPIAEQVRSVIGTQLHSSLSMVARINEVDEEGLSALHHAAIFGDLPLVKFLLANGADPRARDNKGRYPLDHIVAIPEDELNCQQMLIASHLTEATCGLNTVDKDYLLGKTGRYYTALAWAVLAGELTRAEELLDAGADPRLTGVKKHGNQQKNAISLAINNQQFIALLENKLGSSFVPLIRGQMEDAVKNKNHELLARLFDLIDTRDEFFATDLLMLAASVGAFNLIDTLVANGAKVNARNREGDSPLLRAAAHGRPQTAEMLIKHGADVNDIDALGRSAMQLAYGTSTIEVFLNHGIAVDSRDANNNTLAGRGATRNEPSLIRLAIKHGGDVNIHYVNRWQLRESLLNWAVRYHGEMVEELLEAGADPNVFSATSSTNVDVELTPLMLAAYRSSTKNVRVLIAGGADHSLTNSKGQTALDIALERLNELRELTSDFDHINKNYEAQKESLVEIISLLME